MKDERSKNAYRGTKEIIASLKQSETYTKTYPTAITDVK